MAGLLSGPPEGSRLCLCEPVPLVLGFPDSGWWLTRTLFLDSAWYLRDSTWPLFSGLVHEFFLPALAWGW